MKTIEEKNKLIAEFMGGKFKCVKFDLLDTWTIDLPWFDDPSNSSLYFVKQLRYHLSWDWLVPVVEKIENIGVNVQIKGKYHPWHKKTYNQTTIVYDIYKDIDENRATDLIELYRKSSETSFNKLDTVFEAVVEFIEWYNENKLS
jgi:hypothetical protein